MEPPRSINDCVKFYREVVIHPNIPHAAFSNWNQFMMEFREGSTIEVEMERMKAVAGISTEVCAFLGESLLPPELDSGVLKHSSAVIRYCDCTLLTFSFVILAHYFSSSCG